MEEDLTIPTDTLALGRRGEKLAAEYLEGIGYQLVAANFTVPVGRTLRGGLIHVEIDMVAYDGATLRFIEVKTRESDWFAPPEANVDLRKQRQVARAARAYRRLFGLTGQRYRFDVISVTVSPKVTSRATSPAIDTNGETLPHGEANSTTSRPRIELFRNYWTDDKFRKRKWSESHFNY